MSRQQLNEDFVRKTYRYLRIGLLVSVLMLGASVVVERLMVDCWQTSISGYYFTPVRAVFVSALVAVGLAMIAIKGQGKEDLMLNIAGMLAPLVAFIPTRNIGLGCWSSPPVVHEEGKLDVALSGLFELIDASSLNNLRALAVSGLISLLVAVALLIIEEKRKQSPLAEEKRKQRPLAALSISRGDSSVRQGMLVTFVVIVAVWLLYEVDWDLFRRWLHHLAAIGLFGFVAIASRINNRRLERDRQDSASDNPGTESKRNQMFRTVYLWIPIAMLAAALLVGAVFLVLGEDDWMHAVLVLEVAEIILFFIYWIFQTWEHWDDPVGVS